MLLAKKIRVVARNVVFSVLGSGLIVAGAPVAFAASVNPDFHPYIGVGGSMLPLNLKRQYGEALLKQTIIGPTAFAGFRFGDYFGAEVGYNYFSRKGNATINEDDTYPGFGQSLLGAVGNTFIEYKTQTKVRDVNVGITGYLPLRSLAAVLERAEVFGTVGLSRTSLKARAEVLADNNGPVTPGSEVFSFRQKKVVPFVRVGALQNVTDNIHLSIFSEWKSLSQFKINSDEESFNKPLQIRFRNSLSYGLRVGFTFF